VCPQAAAAPCAPQAAATTPSIRRPTRNPPPPPRAPPTYPPSEPRPTTSSLRAAVAHAGAAVATSNPKSEATPCALPPVRRRVVCPPGRRHRPVDPAPSPESAVAAPCAPLLSAIGAGEPRPSTSSLRATVAHTGAAVPVHSPQVPRVPRPSAPPLLQQER
jgi:hypothetical protein